MGKRTFFTVEIIDNKLSLAEFEGDDQLRNFLTNKDTNNVIVFTGKHLPVKQETRLVIGEPGKRRGRPPGASSKPAAKKK